MVPRRPTKVTPLNETDTTINCIKTTILVITLLLKPNYRNSVSMKSPFGVHFLFIVLIILLISCVGVTQNTKQLVRLAVIEVDKSQIADYHEFLKEEINGSIEKEPGVITLYAVAERENPERVTLFETYADSSQYKAHLMTPHFKKYKQGTLQMVKHLELIAAQPLLYHRKAELAKARLEDLYIRLIKIEIDSTTSADFSHLANTVMKPGIKTEPGVLVMYAVAEKNHPTRISVLEVYKDLASYNAHIKTKHFLAYKEQSKRMVKSLLLIDVNPILLGSKPQ